MKKNKKTARNEYHMKDTQNNDRCWWLLASLFMAAMMGLVMASCGKELLQTQPAEGLPATIRLDVMPDAATQAQTRANENDIKDLHILVYNSKGELIGHKYNSTAPFTVKTRSGSGYTLYAIANTGIPTLFNGTAANTETKLKAMKTAGLSAWDALTTASHLAMAGSKTGVTISAGASTLPGGMTVTRIVAKVTLKIGIKPGSGIIVKDYQVFSLPKQSFYLSGATDAATGWINGAKIAVNAISTNKAFFIYENRKGIVNSITAQKDKGASKAPTNSMYVVINGEANGYKATWRVYLGENNTSNFNMKRNSQYTYNITLNRPGTDGADTRVTANDIYPIIVGDNSNSYMLPPGSALTIPVKRANESFIQIGTSPMSSGKCMQLGNTDVWHAELVWESSAGLITFGGGENTGKGSTGRFKVIAKDAAKQGNAVVAIKNSSNQILWSWHIWVTTYDGSTKFTHNNGNRVFTFMDRTLGASSATAGQLTSCGLMYQWGRKDPFPGIGQQGGSWSVDLGTDPIRVYNTSGALYEISKNPVPSTATPNNLTNATRNPDTFYLNATTPFDWFVYDGSSTQNNDLWSGGNITLGTAVKKSVFDPCPAGWRTPPYLNNVSPFAKMNIGWSWSNYGQNWTGTGGHFPASGYRPFTVGTLFSVRTNGYYWSGASIGTKGCYLTFYSAGVSPLYENGRAYGFPLRCSKDE